MYKYSHISIEKLVSKQRKFFDSHRTYPYKFRMAMLKKLKRNILKYEVQIKEALKQDLHKSDFEAYMTEIGITLSEITYTEKHLKAWMRTKCVPTPISQFPTKSFIKSDPYGVALIMAPWNYPFYLTMAPLIGAIAGGNCAILKPSDYSKETSKIIQIIISESFSPSYVSVVEGGRQENNRLLECRFDYIFFTGGVTVGKLVMEKAAKNLTPVTLELGGKSPCIVEKTANINLAAKKIVFGKLLNSGQTCIAPDYVLIDETVKNEFIRAVAKWIRRMYGKNPLENKEYPKIINSKHFTRLYEIIQAEPRILIGGQTKKNTLQIAPTILEVNLEEANKHKVMQEEIFGPILPILSYEQISDAEEFVIKREKPLALYLFTEDNYIQKRVMKNISFGGGCINDTIVHLSTPYMPFGGVGHSGMGGYHGKYSFDTFTHKKSIMKKYSILDLPIRYQPANKMKEKIIRKFLK